MKMTPEAHKVVRDAKQGIKRCKKMNAELTGRIARLQHLDLIAASADNAEQLQWLLRMMQAAGPLPEPANCNQEAA